MRFSNIVSDVRFVNGQRILSVFPAAYSVPFQSISPVEMKLMPIMTRGRYSKAVMLCCLRKRASILAQGGELTFMIRVVKYGCVSCVLYTLLQCGEESAPLQGAEIHITWDPYLLAYHHSWRVFGGVSAQSSAAVL